MDHSAEAIANLNGIVIPNEEPPELYAALAQVHATMYHAEQQRIANLIALAAIPIESSVYNEWASEALSQLANANERVVLGLNP
jgi:hypothetical protein